MCPRYVRIVGTHNTVNRVFHAVSFECSYTFTPVTLDNGHIGESAAACITSSFLTSSN